MHAVIIMTALPPHKGHEALIRFAAEFLESRCPRWELSVIVQGRSFEPMCPYIRRNLLSETFDGHPHKHHMNFLCSVDDVAPQNVTESESEEKFWRYWADSVQKTLFDYNKSTGVDLLFASESYGKPLADELLSEFIPYDSSRMNIKTSGTAIRKNVFDDVNFANLVTPAQRYFMKTVTVFGAESCGKSTLVNALTKQSHEYAGVPEFARGYLEANGAELTQHKMTQIAHGQYALQRAVHNGSPVRKCIIQDTDLLSTIGYYRILGWDIPEILIDMFRETQSDLYFLLPSNIPFEADELRYGGTVRESTDQFWIDLLDEFGCNYVVCASADHSLRVEQLNYILHSLTHGNDMAGDLSRFVRT